MIGSIMPKKITTLLFFVLILTSLVLATSYDQSFENSLKSGHNSPPPPLLAPGAFFFLSPPPPTHRKKTPAPPRKQLR
ncbi:hypothetical protein OROMI_031839 [Orobanche minor]